MHTTQSLLIPFDELNSFEPKMSQSSQFSPSYDQNLSNICLSQKK